MTHHFFAYLSRMKYITRWGLMRNTLPENDMEHSMQAAMFAHAIAVIGNERYNRNYDAEHIMALALYHDSSEVITGDLPTPVKHN
ncbi:MAG: 5'-deoxynucleotidase, partial [Christensenellales bacterium]